MSRRLLATCCALLGIASAGARAVEPTATAVEYYNTIIGHYFMTANPVEAAMVDNGSAGPGWVRTGGAFGVFAGANDAPALYAVCRFYGTKGIGPNSHFYTASADECAQVKLDPGWTYEGIAFYVLVPQASGCTAGSTPIYRAYNNGFVRNDSNHRYTVDYTAWIRTQGYVPEGVAMCAQLSANDVQADAVRLLRQATFGPTEGDVQHAVALGAAGWIDEQLTMPVTAYPSYPWTPANKPDGCVDNRTQPVRPDSYCARDNYSLFPMQLQFFRNAVAQPDQLRGRMAFALSQIMVTSGLVINRNYAMREYQQIFLDRAFGNFYDLLYAVTLSPMMGDYLDMANNNKENPAAGTAPNENYAREIMQLFSIGTVMLNADGTVQHDAQGQVIPAYDQDTIEGFAHVFTGWTYPTAAGANPRNNNPKNYLGTMIPVSANHDFGTKELLNGVMAPANMTMQQDLDFAHQNIFNHPNVGPFIGRQLIQKLVASDPSPAYVQRVAAVFANNGAGQRGDLKAVVRAILTDLEARGARKIDPAYGKLVEPVLYLTHVLRAFGGATDGVFPRLQSNSVGQFVFYAPSVFNFYPPGYVVPGTQLVGPEFGVQTSTTAVNRINFANTLVFSNGIAADQAVYGSTGTSINLSPYMAVASDAGALADRLDRNLLAGTMSQAMRSAIVSAVNAVAASDALNRARTAAYLVVTSSQYQVER